MGVLLEERVEHREGTSFKPLAYVLQSDDTPIQQADFSGDIEVRVFDLDVDASDTPVFTDLAISVGTAGTGPAVWDTAQTGGHATTAGIPRYNFRPPPITAAQHGMRGGKSYRVEYVLTGADDDGSDIMLVWVVDCERGGFTTA